MAPTRMGKSTDGYTAVDTKSTEDIDHRGSVHGFSRHRAAAVIQKHLRRAKTLQEESRNRHDDEWLHEGELVQWRFQTLRFLSFPVSSVMDPTQYLAMTGELFGLVAVVCYICTFIFHPEIFKNNPLKERLGYNNICVGFDVPPSRYIAAVGWALVVYCTLEFAKVTIHRLLKEIADGKLKDHPKWLDYVFILSHLSFACSSAFFLLCFLIPPTEDVYGHTRPFLVYMIAMYFSTVTCVAEHFLEIDPRSQKHIPAKTIEYLLVYGILSFSLPLFAELSYRHYDTYGGHLIPWYVFFAFDWSWLICVACSNQFLPQPGLMVGDKIVHLDTLNSLRARFASKTKTGHAHHGKKLVKGLRRAVSGITTLASGGKHAHDLVYKEHKLRPKEAAALEKLAECFGQQGRDEIRDDPTGAKELGHGLTVTVMRARLTIDDRIEKLKSWQRHGFFKSTGTYDAIVRINVTTHGAVRLSIRIDVPEEMEVLDECETVSSRPGYRQVDLLMAEEFKQFLMPSVDIMLHCMQLGLAFSIGKLFTVLKKGAELKRTIRGFRHAKQVLDNTKGIFGKSFYAGLPFRLGPAGVCKFGLVSKQTHVLSKEEMPGSRPGASMTNKEGEATTKYARAMVSSLGVRTEPVVWDFALQIGKHHPSHSLSEGDVRWSEDVSPYLAVGTLMLIPETAAAGGIIGDVGPALCFNPWNQLKAHKPLGLLQRARLQVYRKHREARLLTGGGKQADLVCPYLALRERSSPSPGGTARDTPETSVLGRPEANASSARKRSITPKRLEASADQ